jgi:uncharacterized protein (DUF305 family)
MKYFIQVLFISVLSLAIINACNNNTESKTTSSEDSVIEKTWPTDSIGTTDSQAHKSGHPMMSMMNRMKAINMTGDFDIDFANMMIEHHQGGVEMSQQFLQTGNDTALRTMAQKIITEENQEISQLKDFVKSYKPSGMKHGEGELNNHLKSAEDHMNMMSMTGNADKDFAVNMTTHHEHGTQMAKMQLKHGMSGDLKKMAQKMIDKNAKEIAELKKWTAQHR